MFAIQCEVKTFPQNQVEEFIARQILALCVENDQPINLSFSVSGCQLQL